MIEPSGYKVHGTRPVADLGFLTIEVRDILTPTGERIERVVVSHPGAVAVVPLIDNDIILIRQYRAAVDDFVIEIPAGKIDDQSDTPRNQALRELAEETGYRANALTHLTDLWTAVGFSDERIAIFLADDLEQGERNPIGYEEEHAMILRIPFLEAEERVVAGAITDAKTVAGILLTAAHRESP